MTATDGLDRPRIAQQVLLPVVGQEVYAQVRWPRRVRGGGQGVQPKW
ncbi:hypothetical protein ABZY58_29270 [Micromonospora tulbaghiae]